MIKILGISGSRVKNGNMEALLEACLSRAGEHEGVETEIISLAGKEINGCNQCNWCVRNQSEEKFCVQEDDMVPVYPKILEADGIILASPAHLGRLSGMLANTADRLRAFVHGNMYRHALKDKIGGALAVAFFRGGGIETTLFSIDLVFLTLQMIVANSGAFQLGAGAFTSREGKGGFEKEPRHIVLEDEYGVDSTRRLADRVVELARIFKAGRETLQKG